MLWNEGILIIAQANGTPHSICAAMSVASSTAILRPIILPHNLNITKTAATDIAAITAIKTLFDLLACGKWQILAVTLADSDHIVNYDLS
jgi:hypothetical protein